MGNRAGRFAEASMKASDTPGPGAYTLSKKSDWLKEVKRSSSVPVDGSTANKNGLVCMQYKNCRCIIKYKFNITSVFSEYECR